MSQVRILLFCVSMVLFGMAGTAYSQTTFASITGTVTDATGAVVRAATIAARTWKPTSRPPRNRTRTVTTRSRSSRKGPTRSGLRRPVSELRSGEGGTGGPRCSPRRRQAGVGDVATEVKVSGGVTLIETETGRISDTKDSLVLNTIPKIREACGHPQSLTWFAGAGRQQRDAIRR